MAASRQTSQSTIPESPGATLSPHALVGSQENACSGPSRQRSLKDRLREGITGSFHWQSRRASQQLSRSEENIDLPPRRSKSRSVDHGFGAPFDLSALRNKVEERFEVVNKGDGELKRIPQAPPIKTITYTVKDKDTLTSLAARFDTTPSELTKLNRLATQYIFAGQSLLVPDRKKADGSKHSSNQNLDSEGSVGDDGQDEPCEKEMLDNLRPQSPETLVPSAPRFLKINVRHITDGQGVVSGVLLVTPNAVMFDPNVSDTLVMEHGAEAYGVIAPMDFVVNAAVFYDIAHMRTPHSDTESMETAEIYFPKIDIPSERSSLHENDHLKAIDDAKSAEPAKEKSHTTSETNNETDENEKKAETNNEKADLENNHEEAKESTENDVKLSNDDDVKKNDVMDEKDDESYERGGNAFPKAFDRDLVNPASLEDEERRGPRLLAPRGSGDVNQMEKVSYHDSGIDIRDPLLNASGMNTKKVYSDADIILSTDWIPPVTVAPAEPPLSAPPHTTLPQGVATPRKHASVSFSSDSNPEQDNLNKDDANKSADKRNKMLKRLSYPLAWMEGLTGDAAPNSAGNESLPASADSQTSSSVFAKVFHSSPINLVSDFGTGLFLNKTPSEDSQDTLSQRSSLGGFGRSNPKTSTASAPPKLDYRSMVSVDDMPDLFASFDKLIPRPAVPSDEPPLYLRLRMGKPSNPAPANSTQRTTPLLSYGRKRMKPEYWFGIPRNRVDDLYKFLNHWVPDLYGKLEADAVTARGYQLINEDLEWEEPVYTRIKAERKPRIESGSVSGGAGSAEVDAGDEEEEIVEVEAPTWEALSASAQLRRALYSAGASLDLDLSPPDLIGNTEILTEEHRQELCAVLPARAQGYDWSLVFSTSQHGFSLSSMYRKMSRVDSPVLLLLQDTSNNVFGALTSCSFRPSDHFYGTGESFLFSFLPDLNTTDDPADTTDKKPKTVFKVWNWTGENMYFIKGSNDNISIGAGDGKFGLWLDGDLYQGRTQACTTYGNEPLTTTEDFIVKILECWAFI